MEWAGMVLLGALLIYQQWYLHKMIKDLVDRLMTRSLHEYESAKNPPPPKVIIKKEEPLESFDRIF